MNKISILIESEDLLDLDKLRVYLKLLKLKEKETYAHSIRVSKYSTKLAIKLGFNDEEVSVIWLAGLLHDLGKLLVPNDILLGSTKLTTEDTLIIKKHPIDGVNYLREFTSEKICLGALEHHERLDGKGYPYGIKNISLIGRIIAIADTFDAMTSNRRYQNNLSFSEALDKMKSLAEEDFYDRELLKQFTEVILEK